MRASFWRGLVLACSLCAQGAPAVAADAQGVWTREDGSARVKIGPCGGALCGTVVWLKNPNGKGRIGERVFYDMKVEGPTTWNGSAFNPEDGRTYSGKMELVGDRLVTTGCAFGGMICRSYRWTRAR